MVSNEGLLPAQKITKRFNLQTFDDDFTTGHAVFHWIWKVTHDWDSVTDLIPRMKSHLKRHQPLSRNASRPTTSGSASSASSFGEETYNDETLLFREAFCIAASDLADRLHIPIGHLGTLFDRITGTGMLAATTATSKRVTQSDLSLIHISEPTRPY